MDSSLALHRDTTICTTMLVREGNKEALAKKVSPVALHSANETESTKIFDASSGGQRDQKEVKTKFEVRESSPHEPS
jgi:hypothetical protein